MITKPGVDIEGLAPVVKRALPEMESARLAALESLLGVQMVVTSGRDGQHGPRSYHPDGYAVDLRTKDYAEAWAYQLGLVLGPGWDIVIESDHIHIERDVRRLPLQPEEG